MPEPSAPAPGPFSHSRATTVKLNALELSIVSRCEASHVPPAPLPAESSGPDLLAAVQQVAAIILSKLEEIRAGQASAGPG